MKKSVFAILILLAGCATAPPRSDSEAINELLQRWRAALLKGDARAVASMVTQDAEFWSAGAAPIIGREQVRQRFAEFFAQYELDQQFNVLERVIGTDHAFLRGTEVNKLTVKANNTELQAEQRSFSVLRKDKDGRWRFARGMTNFAFQQGGAQ